MTDCKTTTGLCQTWASIAQNPHLHIQRIFQGGCLTDDLSKPLALILSSTFDNNGGLSLTEQKERGIFAALIKNHTVCHRYIQNSLEACEHIEQLGQKKKIDVLLMRAHGASHFQAYAEEVISSYSPRNVFAAVFRSSLTAFATIILHSCFNAVTCGVDDFASFIRSIAPPLATVYAATRSNEWIEIQSGTPPEVKMFNGQMDITYRSGADGYCNNPIDSIVAQKMKLQSLCYLVGEGQGIDAAINAASEAFKSTDSTIRDRAIDLFKKLFTIGQGFEATVSVTSEALKSSDALTRRKAIQLRKMLRERF